MRTLIPTLLGLVTLAGPVAGTELTRDQNEFFENCIRPILADHCYSCHSTTAEKIKGGLTLDTRSGVLHGGDSGPAIVPGHPDQSLLVRAVRYTDEDLRMPPKNKKLSGQQIADLEQWVRLGAFDPRADTPAPARSPDAGRDHWAWQPIQPHPVPAVKDAARCQTPVDNFIIAKLGANGLQLNPPADKRTLIRRAYFDVIGLPPTPAEVAEFLEDTSPDAFAQVVEHLLASPHYGERWGRHWLDVARYSDTRGEVRRFREDPENPHAWTYRDYVIRSFNDDKPFNQFILEQIAADLLPESVEDTSMLAALGFLTVGDNYMGMQNDIINDQIDVVTKGFLGLTVSCARCHDHKFDPIPQADYYSLHGVFASTLEPRVLPVIGDLQDTPEYHDYEARRVALIAERNAAQEELGNARRSRDRDRIRIAQREATRVLAGLSRLEMVHPGAPQRAMVVEDLARPRNSNLLIRGEAGNKGPVVPRQFLELLAGPDRLPFQLGSGRLELAMAIADPSNPLTPRVLVNRVWLKHFGEGFVGTPDDLGTMSETPSHPELLDHLALELMNSGWSLKELHRQILLSATWQQSSQSNPRGTSVDPDNRLLWRQNIRPLELEPVRDSLLAISGVLEPEVFGRPFDLTANPQTPRRTVYARVDRQRIPETFIHFDFATPDMPSGRRHVTTVPQQTLFFMNNPLVIEVARKLAARPEMQHAASDEARVTRLYELLYQRPPDAREMALGLDFLNTAPAAADPDPVQVADVRTGSGAPPAARSAARRRAVPQPLTAREAYAQALLEANEFLFVR